MLRPGRHWRVPAEGCGGGGGVSGRIGGLGGDRKYVSRLAAARLELDGRALGHRRLAAQILAREAVAVAVRSGDVTEALGLVIVKNLAAHALPTPIRVSPDCLRVAGGSQGAQLPRSTICGRTAPCPSSSQGGANAKQSAEPFGCRAVRQPKNAAVRNSAPYRPRRSTRFWSAGALPRGNGMDPRVSATSLRSCSALG